ncbi:2690_t:CDS:2 [Funneliformis caledonium]|uniref:2690_t:CDS:1 n=1 Tax=Funneliformis caledonium TaxID=1117310 RepID=A0A9N9CLY7_9GLOM|nr:2690_t:CDS:2 [Funneliformis caledonium]
MSSSKDDIRVVIGIDFGTTYSGYAYAHKSNPKDISSEDKWSSGFPDYKTPTVIKYEDESYTKVKSWGFKAFADRPKKKKNTDKSIPLELFKLFLFKNSSMANPYLPDNLDYKKVITDYLKELCKMVKKSVNTHWQNLEFYTKVLIVLTVCLIVFIIVLNFEFDDDAIAIMRECAFDAGLINEKNSCNLIFTTEPEAAAVYCLSALEKVHNLKPGDSFMVVDCGGGTVDLTRHELLQNSKLSEITERSGENCGSSFIDKKFIEFVGRKLGKSFEFLKRNHYSSIQYMVQEFCRRVKIPFTGQKNEFQCYEIDLEEYPLLKVLVEGKEKRLLEKDDWLIYIEFNDVKTMFDPIVEDIIKLMTEQLKNNDKKCSAIMLVGGFGESRYLQDRIRKEFNKTVPNISVPTQPIIAVVKGAVQFGLQADIVVNRVLKRTYGALSSSFLIQCLVKRKNALMLFVIFVGTDIARRSLPNDPPSQKLPNGYTIIFEALARRGKQISPNDKVIKQFKPYSLTQPNIGFDMYVTKEHDAKFCDDPGVSLLRDWEIKLPEIDNYDDDTTILLTLTFGTVEITATAENQNTGEKYQVKLKYE